METAATAELAHTHERLTQLARRRFGRIAPELLAAHVVAVTTDADWPVREAALEALARRYLFAERDGLRVVERPKRSVLGRYRTARAEDARKRSRSTRPYDTELLSLDPPRASCSCRDFVRNSLGLCKHTLVVLDALAPTPPGAPKNSERSPPSPGLTWDPLHPLRGPADRLARLLRARGSRVRLDGFVADKPDPAVLADPSARAAWIARLETAIERGRIVAEPAVATLLAEERERVTRELEIRAAAAACTKRIAKLRRKLYSYQREGVAQFLARGRLLLADDMGLGKTTQAIASCHALFGASLVDKGLLVVPAALKGQWKREWDATTDAPLAIVDGTPTERARLYDETASGFLVIGYEQLLRDFEHVQRFAPDIVVLDEAQRIKNWATKSAAYVKSLAPRYRLVLTGTPMENRFDELASIMDFVDDVALEPKWRLAPWHSQHAGDGGRGTTGARNLDTLRQRLAGSMLRRIRREVLTQLPSRSDTRVPVEMTEAQRAEHVALEFPIAVLIGKMQRRPLTQPEFLRLMQLLTTQRIICNGLGQHRFAAIEARLRRGHPTTSELEELCSPKLFALRGLVEQVVVGQDRKVVVFSQWRAMLRLAEWSVRDILADAGMKAVFFTGAESPRLRERAVVDLHDDPATTVMFLSDAGGVGLNLQRAATCCVNLELPWNPAVLEQRIGRIYRLGQDHPIDVYNLVTEEGIEARIAGLVAQKQAVFASLFDGTTDEVRFDGSSSFMEGVRRLVEPLPAVPEAMVEADDTPDVVTLADDPPAIAGEVNTVPETTTSASTTPARTDGISIQRMPDGGLRIDAPPALAEPLAALLDQLANALRSG